MWLKKKDPSKEADAPERLRRSRYYEHDGILRAYANRAMVLALLCIPTTLLALAFAVYVPRPAASHCHSRRGSQNGLATVLGGDGSRAFRVTQGPGSERDRI